VERTRGKLFTDSLHLWHLGIRVKVMRDVQGKVGNTLIAVLPQDTGQPVIPSHSSCMLDGSTPDLPLMASLA
jgi:hypothetical protein